MTAAELVGDDVAALGAVGDVPVFSVDVAAPLVDARERLGEVDLGDAAAVARVVAGLDPDIVDRAAEIHADLFSLVAGLPAGTHPDLREILVVAESDAEFVRRFVDPDWTGPEYDVGRRLGPRRRVGVVGRRTRARRSRRRAAQGRRGPPGDPERPQDDDDPPDVAREAAA